MRAICGAVLTAGALIGLGLTSVGAGARYADYLDWDDPGPPKRVELRQTDTGILVAQTALVLGLLVGLGVTFLGLAHHHHQRNQEFLREYGYLPVPTLFGPSVVLRPTSPVQGEPTP
jgi:hypothetical protein